MGKHDKAVFSWDAPETSFLEAENKRLKAENEKLKNTVRALERELNRMDRANDAVADKSCEVIIAKDALIAKLKEALVKEAIENVQVQ